jgi:hypothetical protein
VLLFSSIGFYWGSLNFMPEFKPNPYLFKEHSDKGTQKWEIFAWAVREAISKESDLVLDERPIRDKMAYESFLEMRSDVIKTVQGQHYYAYD